MRIIGGIYRGRTLYSPKNKETRPTSDRTRESIFNILQHGNWCQDVLKEATVLDIFAGTGAMGIESLSQGARHAAFIEQNHSAVSVCQNNINILKETERAIVFKCDAANLIPRPLYLEKRSLVFLDPPYGKHLGAKTLKELMDKDWLKEQAVCILEMSKKKPEILPAGFTLKNERIYGITKVQFLVWEP